MVRDVVETTDNSRDRASVSAVVTLKDEKADMAPIEAIILTTVRQMLTMITVIGREERPPIQAEASS